MVLPKGTISKAEERAIWKDTQDQLNISYLHWKYLCLDYKNVL